MTAVHLSTGFYPLSAVSKSERGIGWHPRQDWHPLRQMTRIVSSSATPAMDSERT